MPTLIAIGEMVPACVPEKLSLLRSVFQGHRKWHRSIRYLWFPISGSE